MKFSTAKCKVLHMRKKNKKDKYKTGHSWLDNPIVNKDHRLNMQHDTAAEKANAILPCISGSIRHNTLEVVAPLYSVLVRPHLDIMCSS